MTHVQFRESFENCTLPPDEFSHEQHIRMAWIYVTSHSLSEAITLFCVDLLRFVKHAGDEDKYHETITWFYMVLVNERASRLDQGHSWEDFKHANPDLIKRGGALLKRHYQPDTLGSEKAKRHFVLPDSLES